MAYIRIDQLDASTFGLHSKGRRKRMGRAAALIVNTWKSLAAQELKSTLDAYSKSIQIAVCTDNEVVVELPGPAVKGKSAMLARIQEFGLGNGGIGRTGLFDIRAALLAKNSKISKTTGKAYRIISFDRAIGALKEEPGGLDANDVFNTSNSKGERVFDTGMATTDKGHGRTAWGARVPPNIGQKLKPFHAGTSVGGGYMMAAESGSSGRVERTRFSTFRTVSLAGSAHDLAWKTSIKAKRIGAKVQAALKDTLLRII